MDPFYYDMQDDVIVDDDDYLATLGGALLPPAVQGSAFAAYQKGSSATSMERYSSVSGANVHQRMFGYLGRTGDGAAAGSKGNGVADAHTSERADRDATASQAPRGSSRFRHIMRERLRRERLSQGFADLHALMPAGASKVRVPLSHGTQLSFRACDTSKFLYNLCARRVERMTSSARRPATSGISKGGSSGSARGTTGC
jgi:hypothetical protein